MDLKGATVLITGGAGFIGSHIADLAVEAGAARVIALDNLERGRHENLKGAAASERLELVEGDICDRDLVFDLSEGCDLVFHQAALRITQCAEQPQRAVEVMLNGVQNVLDAAVEHKVSRVLAASSASVYGEPSYLPMDEGHPFNNRTLYGGLKIANEQLLRSYNEMYGLHYLMFRPFNVYGSRMDVYGVYTEVMIRWLDRLAEDQPPIVFGDGQQTMDFVHVRDVARAYVVAAASDVDDDVFNAGTETETSLLELCHLLCRATGRPDLQPTFQPARKVNGVTRRKADMRRAREVLGFEPQISLEEGLSELVAWHASLAGQEVGA